MMLDNYHLSNMMFADLFTEVLAQIKTFLLDDSEGALLILRNSFLKEL